jgi:hypothetical protein
MLVNIIQHFHEFGRFWQIGENPDISVELATRWINEGKASADTDGQRGNTSVGGGGGGSATYADLVDAASVNLPAVNTPLSSALGAKAPIDSPTFTGTPAGPTAAPGTSSTQLATTAFVAAALAEAPGYPEVLNYAALPGSPTEGDTYITLQAQGIPFINRKAAGMWRYTSGSWVYLGEVPEGYFADNVLKFYDNSDATKQLAFELGGITTGATRTLTVPDASGTLQLTSDNVAGSRVTMATARLLGRTTAGSGGAEEIAIGSGLSMSAGTLSASGGGGTPGGSSGQIQYNNAGAFQGASGITTNGTSLTLTGSVFMGTGPYPYSTSGNALYAGSRKIIESAGNGTAIWDYNDTSYPRIALSGVSVAFGSGTKLAWGSSSDPSSTPDTGISKNSSGLAEVNNGTAGTFRDLKLRTLIATQGVQLTAATVATLPSAASNTYTGAAVSDASSPAVGSTVSGGGSAKAIVRSNGTNWIVTEVI